MLKNIIYLSIFTTFAVVAWIIFSIYQGFTDTTITRDTAIQIVPITPTFDKETIKSLRARKTIPVDLSAKVLPAPSSTSPSQSSSQAASFAQQETNLSTSSAKENTQTKL